MKRLYIIAILLFMTILLVNSVDAPPPIQVGDPDSGWEIKFPLNQVLRENERYAFHFHIFNKTDGLPVISNTFSFGNVSCYFHLYNQTGSHIYTATSTTFTDDFDVEFAVDGGNFTTSGTYSYIAQCNNSVSGGFDSVAIEITNTGRYTTVSQSILYGTGLIVLAFLFIISLYAASKLPKGDNTDELGQILSINHLKYLRPVLFVTAWVLLLSIVFIASNVILAYFVEEMLGKLLFSIYQLMFWMTVALMPLWVLYIFVQIFRDQEVKRMLERGIDVPQP